MCIAFAMNFIKWMYSMESHTNTNPHSILWLLRLVKMIVAHCGFDATELMKRSKLIFLSETIDDSETGFIFKMENAILILNP